MNRSQITLVTLITAALLLVAPLADARPAWHDKGTRTKGAKTSLNKASRAYNKARISQQKYKGLVKRQMKRYKTSKNLKQKQYAQRNAVKAGRAKVRMIKAQARGLQAKAKLAIKAGDIGKANAYQDKASKLTQRASNLSTRLNKAEAKFGMAKPSRAAASTSTALVPVSQSSTAMVPVAKTDKGATTTSTSKSTTTDRRAPKVSTYKMKRQAKLQLKSGNLLGAVDAYKQLEAAPKRKGLGGLVDGYRKWSTRRAINKQAYKQGKKAARMGDMEMATDAVTSMRALDKSGKENMSWNNRRKVKNIAHQSLKGAKGMAKSHRPELASEMLNFHRAVRASVGYKKPTLRYRWVRRGAKSRLMKDMKIRAKQGNMEAFRSSMRLASAYAKEDGRALKKGQLKTIRKLYMTALKNSVPRALQDAQLLLSGRMGQVSVEEAANRYLYAMDTASRLAKRGVEIKTGLFRKSLKKQFSKTRKMLVTSIQNADSFEGKRPGAIKRLWEKITKQPYNRTQPQIAPMNSAWMQRMQRQAEAAQMANMAGAPQQ